MQSLFEAAWSLWLLAWPHLLGPIIVAIDCVATAHAILTKRDTRATIGWVGLIWLSPIFGAVAYALLGVNRIRSRASQLRSGQAETIRHIRHTEATNARKTEAIAPPATGLRPLELLMGRVTNRPLTDGNHVQHLDGGDEAYPEMLSAIDSASSTICLASYIFDNDPTGLEFSLALARAVNRGVDVRVLVDGIGSRYSFPSITSVLRAKGVRTERFLPTSVPIYFPYSNLRNHRKILVVDGRVGFTGGLNIRNSCRLSQQPRHPVRDMHFLLRGPVVAQLLEVFLEDWAFASGETLSLDRWTCDPSHVGTMLARGVRYGPDDDDIGKIKLVLNGALSTAKRSVRIMTPYFIPDDSVCQALDSAALRGVKVDIILPERNNLALVSWASTAMLWQVLGRGCNVWMSSPPFDHSKIMIIDRTWVFFGSGNWDERSLRLNFEFNVEVYDRTFASTMDDFVEKRIASSKRRTLADVDGRSLLVRLRDGVARLLSPYL